MTFLDKKSKMPKVSLRAHRFGIGKVGIPIWVSEMTIFYFNVVLSSVPEDNFEIDPSSTATEALSLYFSDKPKSYYVSSPKIFSDKLVRRNRVSSDECFPFYHKLPGPF